MEEGRRERKKRQTREAIAQTAFKLFAERGFDAVTIADVAEAADVAVNTVFNHFKTKEELFFCSFKPPGDTLAERLRDREPGVSPVVCVEQLLTEALTRIEAPEAWSERAIQHGKFRAVLESSPDLHMQAMHRFRQHRMREYEEVAEALTSPADALASLVAGQLLALMDGTMMEAERRRRAGESSEAIVAAVRPAVERACAMLKVGLGDYGIRDGQAPLAEKN